MLDEDPRSKDDAAEALLRRERDGDRRGVVQQRLRSTGCR
jgi:hypothetical protein